MDPHFIIRAAVFKNSFSSQDEKGTRRIAWLGGRSGTLANSCQGRNSSGGWLNVGLATYSLVSARKHGAESGIRGGVADLHWRGRLGSYISMACVQQITGMCGSRCRRRRCSSKHAASHGGKMPGASVADTEDASETVPLASINSKCPGLPAHASVYNKNGAPGGKSAQCSNKTNGECNGR